MKFCERIKFLREKKGLTQDDLASILNISRQSISKWELGINEPDLQTVKALCKIFDCSLADLLDEDRELETSKEERGQKISLNLFISSLSISLVSFLMIFPFIIIAPNEIITHIGINGNLIYGSKYILFLFLIFPLLASGFTTLFYLLSKRREIYKKSSVYTMIVCLVMTIILSILTFVLIPIVIHKGVSNETWIKVLIPLIYSILMVIAPFTHPKFNKQNPIFGFRTTFSLSNKEAWEKLNSFSAIGMFISSAISYLLSLIFIRYYWTIFFVGLWIIVLIMTLIYQAYLKKKLG